MFVVYHKITLKRIDTFEHRSQAEYYLTDCYGPEKHEYGITEISYTDPDILEKLGVEHE